MYSYLLKRLLLIPLMMLGITVISFLLIQLAPGASGTAGQDALDAGGITPQQYEIMRQTFYLGEPIHLRYLYWLGVLQMPLDEARLRQLRVDEAHKLVADASPEKKELLQNYIRHEGRFDALEADALKKELSALDSELARQIKIPRRGMIFGDFGQSVAAPSVSVATKIADALPVTAIMSLLSILAIYGIAIPLGIFGAVNRDTWKDRLLGLILFALYSMPNFWVAIMLIRFQLDLPPSIRLPIQGLLPSGAERLPTLDYLWEMFKHLILPVISLSYAGLAGISRYMRSSMIEELNADYVRTARAKGCHESRVVWKHAVRNSLIPIVTFLGGLLPALISGSFIVESIFGIPGMGYLSYTAILNRDYTILMTTLTMSAFLLLIGLIVSDVLYVLVDPRISFERKK